ncbi:MAG TPA: HemK/PrmC family methyltransferase, partial [Trueperaceae bacterium]
MTVAASLRRIRDRLAEAGVESPEAEAYLMLSALLGRSRSELLLERERQLGEDERATLRRWLARRAAREPLQHILGTAHFYGLELTVTPEVLIPRPETERLVELALGWARELAAPRILDVGTGSGAIALALKHERPTAQVWGSDLSASALELAALNAERLDLAIELRHSDLLKAPEVAGFARHADLLVSNPPYLPA